MQNVGRRTRSSVVGRRVILAEKKDHGELDYLVDAGKLGPSSSDAAPETNPSSRQIAPDARSGPLAAFAAKLVLQTVSTLEAALPPGSKGVRLSECANQIEMSADVIVPLAAGLEKAELLTVLERESFGDHLVATTPKADALLAADDPVTLLRELGLE